NVTVIKTELEYIVNVLIALCRFSGHHELLVEITEVDIGIRHGSYESKNDGLLRLFASQHAGPRCLGGSSQLPPEVDFPGGADKDLEVSESGASASNSRSTFKLTERPDEFTETLSAPGCASEHLGKKRRARCGIETKKLIDSGRRDLDVFVILQRALHQPRQDRVIVSTCRACYRAVPGIGARDALLLLPARPPYLRYVNLGPLIVRPNHAAEEGKGKRQ